MVIELQYSKLITDNGIVINDLPEDVRIGIKSISGQLRALNMLEKGGKSTESALKKIQREDRVLTAQINEFLKEKVKSDEPPKPAEPKKDTNEPKASAAAVSTVDDEKTKATGLKIEKELAELFKGDKKTFTLEELKTSAPASYAVIFDTYEKGSENGLETSNYRLVAGSDDIFTLSKI